MWPPVTCNSPLIVISINTSWNYVNFRAGLVRALLANGYRVMALAPEDDDLGPLREDGLEFQPIRLSRQTISPLADLRTIWDYWRTLRRLRPRALLAYTAKPNIYGSIAARFAGVKTINNVAGLGRGFIKGSRLAVPLQMLYRLAFVKSHKVFFQNREDADSFVRQKVVRAEQAATLPGSGVDLALFQPSAGTSRSEDIQFLFLGRLLWPKGLAELAGAISTLRGEGLALKVTLVGFAGDGDPQGVSLEQIRQWTDQGVFSYTGPTADVRGALQSADCVVLPTYYPEGTPRSLLEAAAMGRPIITTDRPGCREVVVDGANGYLCEERDERSLTDAMRAFILLGRDAREEMGRRSREIAETKFDEAIVIQAYLTELADIPAR